MDFSSLVSTLDSTVIDAFGKPQFATVNYKTGGYCTFSGVVKNPAMEEDYVPGSQAGVSVLRLFTRPEQFTDSGQPLPSMGDTVIISGIVYDVSQAPVDREGGITLQLRRRSK